LQQPFLVVFVCHSKGLRGRCKYMRKQDFVNIPALPCQQKLNFYF
jgi:hypothetical protein